LSTSAQVGLILLRMLSTYISGWLVTGQLNGLTSVYQTGLLHLLLFVDSRISHVLILAAELVVNVYSVDIYYCSAAFNAATQC